MLVVLGVVIGLGGFRERRDILHTVPIGATISTGAFDYTFTRATVQQQKDLDTPIYKVLVYGTAQNTTDIGRGPSTDQFVGRDNTDKEVEEPQVTKIGTSSDFTVGTVLNPGLPPVPFRIDFEFKQSWRPTGTFRIAAANMTEQKYFLNEAQPNWQNDASTIYQVYVPMQTLAPATS